MILTLPNGVSVTLKPKPWWLFWVARGYTITLSPTIYTEQYMIDTPGANMDVWMHESVHLKQQASNPFWFYLKYAFSRKFRYESELEAYTYQLHYYQSLGLSGLEGQVEYMASILSSVNYVWCVSKDKALKDLTAAITPVAD